MKKILVFGATSAIAQAIIRKYAEKHCEFLLFGRNIEKLEILSGDLKVRGAKSVHHLIVDFSNSQSVSQSLHNALTLWNEWDMVLVCHGSLPDQEKMQNNFQELQNEYEVNLMSVLQILTVASNRLEKQNSGHIAVITSVAGERGKKSNYAYGAAKGALIIFLQGLRQRLQNHNITVTDLRPGFTDSPMTAHLKKGLLFSSSQKVGELAYKALEKKKDVVYLPSFWWLIMRIFCSIPEKIFKKLKL
ncbi:MAG: SDR family NAD(P)-dependent oxidoreductase [Halobacteriovoraceae bacterium]|nr:SDR family NAD(P)-dependent oxidoreductase [Halobacteriovoraceae bacterium]